MIENTGTTPSAAECRALSPKKLRAGGAIHGFTVGMVSPFLNTDNVFENQTFLVPVGFLIRGGDVP